MSNTATNSAEPSSPSSHETAHAPPTLGRTMLAFVATGLLAAGVTVGVSSLVRRAETRRRTG